jgi:uncharacterized protein YecT (DUF1311 family)
MYWRYAPVILICLWSFAHASEEAVENAASPTLSEPTGHVTKKLKQVKPSAATNGACEYTGNSKEDVACSYQKYLVIEAQLNTRYEQLLVELDKITEKHPRLVELKPKLMSAQQAWVNYRKNQCRAVEVWYTGGTLRDALYNDCMRSLGEKRIEELNSFTSNQT